MTREPVQMLWIGSRLSPLERLSIASFLAHGHAVDLYAYAPIEGVPPGTRLCDARAVLAESEVFTYTVGFGKGSPAAFANQFRYRLLLERGGTWCDTDMVCLKPLDFLEQVPYAIAAQRPAPTPGISPGDFSLNACLLKAPAGSAVMRECDAACRSADRAALRWGMTGPNLATKAFVAHGLVVYAIPPEKTCPVNFWQVAELVNAPFQPRPEWHAIHFWNEMWRARGLDKEAVHAPGCAYETLKRRYSV